MKIINRENIPLIESFIIRFGKEITTIFEGLEIPKITIIGEKTEFFDSLLINGIVHENGYFGMNGPLIGYRASNVDELNLTEEERFAMIAHEFGHIYHIGTDYGKESKTDFLQKELDADKMACRLELTERLISGLRKIMENGECEGGIEQMERRIDELSKM